MKIFLSLLLAVSVGISLLFVWKKELYYKSYFTLPFKILLFKILLFLLVLRFGAITSVYTSELLYNSVLHVEYVESNRVITQTKDSLEELQQNNKQFLNSKKDSAWYELELSARYNELKSNLNISKQLDSLKSSIEEASKNIITLITIFIVQTVVMPLIFLWLFLISIKWIFRVKVNSDNIALYLHKG
ncbi:MAG: hypothetical protein L3J19_03660 [Sulfurimonas sp.]|nr:hypothetical protein [Sulfurimonas sp.]